MHIIGCGFGRTGTLSLKTALDELGKFLSKFFLWFRLGLGPTYHMNENIINNDSKFWTKIGFEENPKTRQEMLKKFFDNSKYKSSVDFPANVFFDDLMQIYPNAKIILSVRDSPESWAKSARETIFGYESGSRISFERLPGVNQLLRLVPFVGTYHLTKMIEVLVPRMFVKNKPDFSLLALSAACWAA